MNKQQLTRFISKYHLLGAVNSVILSSNNNKLSTRFITGDKTLLGELTMKDWEFNACTMGIYNTDQLLKLLTVLSDNINLKSNMAGDKVISLEISDTYSTATYMLSDLSVINKAPTLKKTPEFELKLKIDSNFINTFISGKNALPDALTFAVLSKNDKVNLTIGYDIIGTNRITLPISVIQYKNIEPIFFNADLFKNILVVNKECESGLLEISSEGLARITFNVDNYSVVYYLVSNQS